VYALGTFEDVVDLWIEHAGEFPQVEIKGSQCRAKLVVLGIDSFLFLCACHHVLLCVAVHVLIIAPKSIEVNHPFRAIELCATAVKGTEWMLYDSVGCIVVVQLEAMDNEILKAIVFASA
jgi:hypothetical protein